MKKISLRPIRMDDLEHTLAWHNDEQISGQILSYPPPIERSAEEKWLIGLEESEHAGVRHLRIIELEEDGKVRPVGFVQLLAVAESPFERRLGIVIADPTLRGQGLGAEALRQMIAWSVGTLGTQRILLEVRSDNLAAIRFYSNLGFVKCGTATRNWSGQLLTMEIMGYMVPPAHNPLPSRPHKNFCLWAALAVIVVFSSVVWVWELVMNHGEPAELTALFRYFDYSYFGSIVRAPRHLFSEYMLLDSDSTGLVPLQLSTVLPYTFVHWLFGFWGFWLGDLFANLLRFGAIYYLASTFGKDKKLTAVMAFAFFFLSSEYVLGDYTSRGFVQGVWSLRIPRPMIPSSFLLFSVGVLARLPEILNREKLKFGTLLLLALPVVLLFNGDFFSFIPVGFVYFGALLFWLQGRVVSASRIGQFVGAGALVAVPFFAYLKFVSRVALERAGSYPVWDQLLMIEIPSRLQLGMLFLSFVLAALALRSKTLPRAAVRLAMIGTAVFGASFMASPFFAVVNSFSIQDYHYAFARDQLAGLLLCLWVLLLPVWILSVPRLRAHATPWLMGWFLLVGVVTTAVNFSEVWDFAKKFAVMRTEPEDGFRGHYHEGWRKAAEGVLREVQSQAKDSTVVFATYDTHLRSLLQFVPNAYSYLADPQQTMASDTEIEMRFLILASLFRFDPTFFNRWITDRTLQLMFLSGGRYQFNRLSIFGRLSEYPAEALDSLKVRRDNWSLVAPKAEIERTTNNYRLLLQAPASDPIFVKYRLPDLIIIPREFGEAGIPLGYALLSSDAIFRIYKRL